MSAKQNNLWRDDSGAAMLEFTAAAFTFFIVLFGIIEFSNVYYQWNAATKAMQFGARVAAVSGPVDTDLKDWDGFGLASACYTNSFGDPSDGVPGDYIDATNSSCGYDITCTSSAADGSAGSCTGGGTYDATAMRNIVFGRCDAATETCPRTACVQSASLLDVGMCNLFTRIDARNVQVRYEYTGLGYAGRPGGPVPTVTVSLRNLNYDFVLIGGFLPTNTITMPSFATTVTGEDLNVSWSG